MVTGLVASHSAFGVKVRGTQFGASCDAGPRAPTSLLGVSVSGSQL